MRCTQVLGLLLGCGSDLEAVGVAGDEDEGWVF